MSEGPRRGGHRGTRALQRMIEYAPGCGALALWARHEDLDADAEAAGASPVATDGHALFYAAAFETLPLDLQTGWVARCVLHIALRHPQRLGSMRQRLGDVDERLYTLCADAIVASTLAPVAWLRLPDDGPMLEQLLATALRTEVSAEAALQQWDVESLYTALDDRSRRVGRQGRGSDALHQRNIQHGQF